MSSRTWLLLGGAVAMFIVLLTLGAPSSPVDILPVEKREKAPEYSATDLQGNLWQLNGKNAEGKESAVTVLNFWATWCPPCRQETPDFVGIAHKYADRPVQIIGVSVDEDEQSVRQFIRDYRIPYRIIHASNGQLPFPVQALPMTLIVDRKGRIAKVQVGAISASSLRTILDHLLAEGSESPPR